MEIIVCQTCDEVIGFQEAEKAGTLYGACCECQAEQKEQTTVEM
jgi:hypothetical protein